MPDVVEGTLRLQFPAGWQLSKFDDSPWYVEETGRTLKAMDILAANGSIHWWIEIKDCAGFEPDNRPRLAPADPPEVDVARQWVKGQGYQSTVSVSRKKQFIVDEMAEKIEGTLCALAAAARAEAGNVNAARVLPMTGAFAPASAWHVVLLLTWAPPDFKRLAMRLRDMLMRRLKFYNLQCFVLNETDAAPLQPWALSRFP